MHDEHTWPTSAFMQYSELDINYQLGNDGGPLISNPTFSSDGVAEASAGLACRVDGYCHDNYYGGNVCQGGPRVYNSDATDPMHTVWLYIRPRVDRSPVCTPTPPNLPTPPPPPAPVLG